MPSRTASRLFAALLGLASLLALAAALAWWQRYPLAHWWLLRELARLGVAPASLEVARFDLRRLELRALRAGAGDALAIDAIDADYTLADLRQGRVGALRIAGVRLSGGIDATGAHLGGLEALAAGGAADAPVPPEAGLRLPALPSRELVIEDARAEITTRQGPLTVDLSVDAHDDAGRTRVRADLLVRHALADATAQLELAGEGESLTGAAAFGLRLAPGAGLPLPLSAGTLALGATLEIQGAELRVALAPGPFALTLGEGTEALRLEGSTPEARLLGALHAGALAGGLHVETSGGELRAPTLELAARGLEIDARLEPATGRIEGRLALRQLEDLQRPPRAPPLGFEGRVEPREPGLGFELRAADPQQRLVVNARGTYDPGAGSGDVRLRLEPLRFAKGGLQPAQLAPQLAGLLGETSGLLEASARVRRSPERTRVSIDLAARDLAFETPNAQIEALNGTLRITGPSPLATPAGQLVSIGRIGFGLDLTNGLIEWQLRPDGVVAIERAEWQTLGGRVHTAGRLDPNAPSQALVLEAEALDLAQLLALVALEGLSGEGVLDGRLPIVRTRDAIEIHDGLIRARPGGTLRYRPGPGVAGLARSGQGFDLLLGAFENLRYETLEVELDGDANGLMKISLRVRGVNPDFQDGRPFHYNLNVESRLADLLRQGAAVYKIPQTIEERLERFGKQAR